MSTRISSQKVRSGFRRGTARLLRPVQRRAYESLVGRSLDALSAGDSAAAKMWARRAIRVRSTPPEAWLALGRAELESSNSQAVLDAAKQALRRDASSSDAKALRFAALLKLNRIPEAISTWNEFTDADIQATDPDTRVSCAIQFFQAGYLSEAATVASTVRHEGAAHIEVEALLSMGRIADLAEVLPKIDLDVPERLRSRAWFRVNVEEGQLRRAKWWLDRLAGEPDELHWLLELSELLLDENQPRLAHDCLARALSLIRPGSPMDAAPEYQLLVAGTMRCLAIGAARTAHGFSELLITDYPDHPWSWLWHGRALRAGGSLAEAREAVEASLSRQNNLFPAWEELTAILRASDETGEHAVAANRRVIELANEHPTSALRAVTNLVELGDRDHAKECLDRLVSSYPDDPDVMAGHCLILKSLGLMDESEAALDEIEHRGDLPGRVALFRLSLNRATYVEAGELILQLPSESLRPAEVRTVASALRAQGELSKALEILDRVRGQHRDRSLEHLRVATKDELDALKGKSTSLIRRGTLSPVAGRVLHLVGKSVPHFSSGYTIRTKYLVEAQRRAGIDAWVLTEPGFPWSIGVQEAPLEESIEGVTYIRCPSNAEEGEADIDRMADIVRRVRPAVLHAASDFRNAVNALTLGQALDIPVIYEVRGIWEETWVSKRGESAREREHFRLRKQRETECVLAVDRIVTLSETMKAELVSRGVQDDKITVVPNAVDADRFPIQTRDPALAKEWGIGPDDVTVGYISSLVAYEGIQYLLEAVVELRNRGKPVKALIVGDGEERVSLEAYAATLSAGDGVIFTGHVPHDEILRYYGLIDVFVIPRTAARVSQLVTPLKPYEAMATGRALVVSGVDALREVVDGGETGLVFEPENSEDLARQLDRLVSDATLRTRLGGNAATAVRQAHTWASNAHKYRDLYRDMGVI